MVHRIRARSPKLESYNEVVSMSSFFILLLFYLMNIYDFDRIALI